MFINKPSVVSYIVAGGTSFPFEFKWYSETDIKVWRVPVYEAPDDVVHLLPASSYTVDSNASKVGGSIEVGIDLTDGDTITIARELPVTRTIDYAKRGSFPASTVNEDQEYQTYLILDAAYASAYFLHTPTSGGEPLDLVFPAPSSEAYLRWNLAGDALINDLEPSTWRTETEQLRNETEALRNGAASSATTAQLEAWVATAEEKTAASYAVEPAGVLVKRYTSNGDGTFTAIDTNVFSALHYAAVAGGGLTFVGFIDASTNPPYPAAGSAAEFWIISADGTIGGDPFLTKDELHWDATGTQWLKLPNVSDWSAILNKPSDGLDGTIPIGGIIPYSGLLAAVAANWQICDGTNGTPNMTESFVMGTSVQGNIGTTGGSNDAAIISHSHDLSFDSLAEHSHAIDPLESYNSTGGGSIGRRSLNDGSGSSSHPTWTLAATSAGTPSTQGGGNRTEDAGSSGNGRNRPAFVQLGYIQRMS